MQIWYYTNLNKLKRVYNVNNTSYVRQDTCKFKSTRKPCKIISLNENMEVAMSQSAHDHQKMFLHVKVIVWSQKDSLNLWLPNIFGDFAWFSRTCKLTSILSYEGRFINIVYAF